MGPVHLRWECVQVRRLCSPCIININVILSVWPCACLQLLSISISVPKQFRLGKSVFLSSIGGFHKLWWKPAPCHYRHTDGSWKNAVTRAADQQVHCTLCTDGRSCKNTTRSFVNNMSFSEACCCFLCSKNVTQHIVEQQWDQLSRENDWVLLYWVCNDVLRLWSCCSLAVHGEPSRMDSGGDCPLEANW